MAIDKSGARAPCWGLKFHGVRIFLGGIERMHVIAKGQTKCTPGTDQSIADRFYALAT
jgi:hypothetical protein